MGNNNDLAAELANDPLRFIKLCWPEMKLSETQREVLLSVPENIETFVHAANKTGKTRIAAITALLRSFTDLAPGVVGRLGRASQSTLPRSLPKEGWRAGLRAWALLAPGVGGRLAR